MPTNSKTGPRSRGRTGARFYAARARTLAANQICQFKGNDKYPPCGQYIDLELKYPDPMSPTVNHIKPSSEMAWDDPDQWSLGNLESMHLLCNQRLGAGKQKPKTHPTSRNWRE